MSNKKQPKRVFSQNVDVFTQKVSTRDTSNDSY
jgi:hypothetical protein